MIIRLFRLKSCTLLEDCPGDSTSKTSRERTGYGFPVYFVYRLSDHAHGRYTNNYFQVIFIRLNVTEFFLSYDCLPTEKAWPSNAPMPW